MSYSTVGVYTVTWSYDDGNGNISTQTQSVTVIDCSGIENINGINATIYPNPSNGVFTLSVGELPAGNTEIKVIDAVGQVLYAGRLTSQMSDYDFGYLSPGVYYVQITNDGRNFSEPFIVTQKN